jgi:peptidoglycan-associated lipoprotein
MMSFSQFVLVFGLGFLLVGCGSSVKLEDVPVEDRKPSPVAVAPVDQPMAAKSAVAPVNLTANQMPSVGPTGAAKVVYFDFDSFVIKPEFQSVLEAHARHLKSDARRKVNLEGHADERGGREYNLALGQKRSEAVRRALALLGVAEGQMEAVSFGKEKPAAMGSDESAFSKNRRAELTYR